MSLISFNFTNHLLVNIYAQNLHFCCQFTLRKPTLRPNACKNFSNNIFIFTECDLFHSIISTSY
nr:MAG TPA: hypothetical protein [Caudoviricetes sp.]